MRNPVCRSCELSKTCQTVCLWGEGPKKAEVMIVVEAPGKDEDAQGKPITGKVGRLLFSIFEEFGLKRESVYITNAIKCRPPQNRTPKRQEIQVCRKYLSEEIKAVNPRLIICMGGTSIRAVTGDHRLSVAKARTSKYKYFNGSVRTTFHPASVFRVPYNYKLIQEDFARFLGKDSDMPRKEYRRQVQLSPHELPDHLKMFAQKEIVALDLETNGLDPFERDPKIWTVGFSVTPLESFVIPIHHRAGNNPDPDKSLREIEEFLLRNKHVKVIGHNIKFDLKWLMRFGVDIKCKVFDTMIAFHLLEENYPNKSLKHLAQIYTPMGDYAREIQELRKGKEFPDQQFPLAEMVKYNGEDCDATLRLYHLFFDRLKQEKLLRYMSFQMELLKVLTRMEVQGVKVNMLRLNQLVEEYSNKLVVEEQQIRAELGDINLDSPMQLAKSLYEIKGFKPEKLTEGGAPSTDEEALELLRKKQKCQIADLLISRRKTAKVLNTYLYGKSAQIKEDGRIHTTYHMASNREGDERGGTVTGRLGSDMQQIPKVGGIKSMFVPSFKGGLICSADYSQIELRIMAHFSKDPSMLETFGRRDADIHLSVASKVFGKPEEKITKLERSHVKAVNFGIIYCIGPNKLADQLGCSVNKASRFMDEWFEAYPTVRTWIRETEKQVINQGYVTTLFGRKRRLLGGSKTDGTGREVVRQGVNFPIQGSAADLTLFGMVLLHQKMRKEQVKSKLILTVHDSIVIDMHPDDKNFFAQEIPNTFENLPIKETFGVELLVPLKIDVSFGANWEECENYA